MIRHVFKLLLLLSKHYLIQQIIICYFICVGSFDLIIGTNLMCRLPSPRAFLKSVSQFLNPGGMLILVSPYSWLEEYTAKEEWIGAQTKESGKNLDSYEQLTSFMKSTSPSMIIVHRENVPFTIREHERKFQYGVSDCVVFLKSNESPVVDKSGSGSKVQDREL